MEGENYLMTSSIYTNFKPGIKPSENRTEEEWWFLFHGNKLLVRAEGDDVHILSNIDIKGLNINIKRSQYLGVLEGCDCYSGELQEAIYDSPQIVLKDLRPLLERIDEDRFLIAGRAFQIMDWDRSHQYCGRCGTLTITKADERAKECPKCGFLSYPSISPAVIVAIIRDGKILLAHNAQFKNNIYSVIAGFVEPGETFEECVKREVDEEVGIDVKNIRYFANQPWPFPHSQMVAFTAEYAGREINVDGLEIDDAGWFNVDNLPNIPLKGSIARRLVEWFIDNNGAVPPIED